MKKTDLLQALNQKNPSPDFTMHEKALWLTYHDRWEEAHNLVQEHHDALSSLIHGFLHQVEGDHWNGDYWYRRSGYDVPKGRHQQWAYIVDRIAEYPDNVYVKIIY